MPSVTLTGLCTGKEGEINWELHGRQGGVCWAHFRMWWFPPSHPGRVPVKATKLKQNSTANYTAWELIACSTLLLPFCSLTGACTWRRRRITMQAGRRGVIREDLTWQSPKDPAMPLQVIQEGLQCTNVIFLNFSIHMYIHRERYHLSLMWVQETLACYPRVG